MSYRGFNDGAYNAFGHPPGFAPPAFHQQGGWPAQANQAPQMQQGPPQGYGRPPPAYGQPFGMNGPPPFRPLNGQLGQQMPPPNMPQPQHNQQMPPGFGTERLLPEEIVQLHQLIGKVHRCVPDFPLANLLPQQQTNFQPNFQASQLSRNTQFLQQPAAHQQQAHRGPGQQPPPPFPFQGGLNGGLPAMMNQPPPGFGPTPAPQLLQQHQPQGMHPRDLETPRMVDGVGLPRQPAKVVEVRLRIFDEANEPAEKRARPAPLQPPPTPPPVLQPERPSSASLLSPTMARTPMSSVLSPAGAINMHQSSEERPFSPAVKDEVVERAVEEGRESKPSIDEEVVVKLEMEDNDVQIISSKEPKRKSKTASVASPAAVETTRIAETLAPAISLPMKLENVNDLMELLREAAADAQQEDEEPPRELPVVVEKALPETNVEKNFTFKKKEANEGYLFTRRIRIKNYGKNITAMVKAPILVASDEKEAATEPKMNAETTEPTPVVAPSAAAKEIASIIKTSTSASVLENIELSPCPRPMKVELPTAKSIVHVQHEEEDQLMIVVEEEEVKGRPIPLPPPPSSAPTHVVQTEHSETMDTSTISEKKKEPKKNVEKDKARSPFAHCQKTIKKDKMERRRSLDVAKPAAKEHLHKSVSFSGVKDAKAKNVAESPVKAAEKKKVANVETSRNSTDEILNVILERHRQNAREAEELKEAQRRQMLSMQQKALEEKKKALVPKSSGGASPSKALQPRPPPSQPKLNVVNQFCTNFSKAQKQLAVRQAALETDIVLPITPTMDADGTFHCSDCDFKEKSWKALLNHVKDNHYVDNGWRCCPDCCEWFAGDFNLKIHRKDDHNKRMAIHQIVPEFSVPLFVYGPNSKPFNSEEKLHHYFKTQHAKGSAFRCEECPESFHAQEGLQYHQQYAHVRKKPPPPVGIRKHGF